ncbi:MAG: pilus assembly protein TadG-related protein [Myxococcota bacterium]
MSASVRRNQTGNYSMLVGFMLPVFLGFTALSVDTSWISVSQSQAQDVADAAAHAALVELRLSGDQTQARNAAELVIASNNVGGQPAGLGEFELGTWERGSDFVIDLTRPNAVLATVERTAGSGGVGLHFAKIWGKDEASVSGSATAATRSLQAVLVMDITHSFYDEIQYAEDAALEFLTVLEDTHGEYDKLGMVVFYQRYAYEWTPLFELENSSSVSAARAQWGNLRTASLPSTVPADQTWRCFTTPPPTPAADGGISPQMPPHFCDEGGTDHHVGLVLGRQMFDNDADPFAYRAMVLLTDGRPSPYVRPTQRDNAGFTETRWNEYIADVSETVQKGAEDIEQDTIDQALDNYVDANIHLWTVSFEHDNAFLDDAQQGDGDYFFTTDPNELEPIFNTIAQSMPLLLVK